MKQPHPGEIIPIKINGLEIFSRVDSEGVQRLPREPYLNEMADCGAIDFTRLASCSIECRRWVYQNTGLSLSAYAATFPDDQIENPLWVE